MLKNILKKITHTFGFELKRMGIAEGFWFKDPDFRLLFEKIQDRTLVKADRCYMIYQLARFSMQGDGDVAELGVYKGGTARLLAEIVSPSNKRIFLLDTFEGLPNRRSGEMKGVSDFSDAVFLDVQNYLSGYQHVEFLKGVFPRSAEQLKERTFSFVHLDADLYESTRDGLDFFFPRLSRGGVIVVDDYGSRHWPGVKKAVDEFCKKNHLVPIVTASVQCALIKSV